MNGKKDLNPGSKLRNNNLKPTYIQFQIVMDFK